MKQTARGAPGPRPTRTEPARAPWEPVPLGHPAGIATAAVAIAVIAVSVTTRLSDPDFWQHLLVGRAIWELHAIPRTHLWTWPSYGQHEVLFSWGFRAVLWPFWKWGGLGGLYAWRWLTTLGAFALAWAASRVLGARGLVPMFAIVTCALVFRTRTEMRPETLVAVLLALEILLLELWRRGYAAGPWLVAIAWVWANVHLSYFVGLALLAIHGVAGVPVGAGPRPGALDEWGHEVGTPRGERPQAGVQLQPGRQPSRWIVLVAAVLVSFANPFGWRALAQPFEYFTTWRHEAIYATIWELRPSLAAWRMHVWFAPLLVAWPVLAVWRPRGRPLDRAELLTCVLFTALAVFGQRFAGFHAVAAAAYVARGLDAWRAALPRPAWLASPALRGAVASGAIALAFLPEAARPEYPLGIGIQETYYPIHACDFMERHGVRGHGFNLYHFGGYQLWRFWPDRDRLPFMDIHQTGTPEDRDLSAYAMSSVTAWQELDAKHLFDYALLDGHQDWVAGDHLLDFLDADTTWALVFRDDASALYVRRHGALAAVADTFGYTLIPGGNEALGTLGSTIARDPRARPRAEAELERMLSGSPLSARTHSLAATLTWLAGDTTGTRRHLEEALRVDPRTFGAHRRLGYLLLAEQRPRDAIGEFERELALRYEPVDTYARLGQAWEQLGDRDRASQWYRKQLGLHPEDTRTRARLDALNPR